MDVWNFLPANCYVPLLYIYKTRDVAIAINKIVKIIEENPPTEKTPKPH